MFFLIFRFVGPRHVASVRRCNESHWGWQESLLGKQIHPLPRASNAAVAHRQPDGTATWVLFGPFEGVNMRVKGINLKGFRGIFPREFVRQID